jgi:hypothetical protein
MILRQVEVIGGRRTGEDLNRVIIRIFRATFGVGIEGLDWEGVYRVQPFGTQVDSTDVFHRRSVVATGPIWVPLQKHDVEDHRSAKSHALNNKTPGLMSL